MGVSDRYHFAWFREALERFEGETGRLADIRKGGAPLALWCFGGQQVDPAIDFLLEALGRDRTELQFCDKFPRNPGVQTQDINALASLPDNSCDVFTLIRASFFIADPPSCLEQVRRVVKPGGLAIIDWLHGLSDAPVLNLPGRPKYGDEASPFLTTYADPQFLVDFPATFEAFIRHVNRPPSWTNVGQPGVPVPVRERIARLLGGGPRRQVTLETYLDTLRVDLKNAGKRLVEPELMEQYFKVVFRDVRYFYPMVQKFNLFLLTVLQPVGK